MAIVSQNINRLDHLLALFKLKRAEFLNILNEDGGAALNEEDVFSSFVKTSVLNRIDKIFNKGFTYYANPSLPVTSSEESIFFRKDNFNSTLNLRDKQVVNKFEEEKLNFYALSKLTDTETDRSLPSFTILDNPTECANKLRKLIYPYEKATTKDFLKNLISALAKKNVLVFEFVDGNRALKANINGFYSSPNVIVLKWQKYTKREVFTLAHEIGHYLLNEEDIDEKINPEVLSENIGDIERWCNEFAFSFLAGNYLNILSDLDIANTHNDYNNDIIEVVSENTHLSKLALYTHLLYAGKISKTDYNNISISINAALKEQEKEAKRLLELKREQDKLAGKKSGGVIKELFSPLYVQVLQTALYNGIVDEYEFCRKLKISPSKIESYLA